MEFHIYLNVGIGENLHSPHVRYSFAHELGHYFIDEHRWELMNSGYLAHIPDIPLLSQHIYEKEAEFFASCLLMPRSRVIHDITTELFSIDTVQKICGKYQVSLSAALSRYMAVSSIPIMVIHTYTDGTFDYHLKSRNFPFYKLNLSPGNIVPVASKAWECCFTIWNDYTSPKVNQAEVWFCPKNENDALRTFNEHCFLQPAIGRVVSVIWEIVN